MFENQDDEKFVSGTFWRKNFCCIETQPTFLPWAGNVIARHDLLFCLPSFHQTKHLTKFRDLQLLIDLDYWAAAVWECWNFELRIWISEYQVLDWAPLPPVLWGTRSWSRTRTLRGRWWWSLVSRNWRRATGAWW